MFDRFTDHARTVMGLSRQASQRAWDDEINERHILHGLLSVQGTTAMALLEELGADTAVLRRELESAWGRGAKTKPPTLGQLPFTFGAKRLLEASLEQAVELGDTWIGTEHLLLGLLAGDHAACEALLSPQGVTRAAVLDRLGSVRVGPDLTADGEELDPVRGRVTARLDRLERIMQDAWTELQRLRDDLESLEDESPVQG